MEKLVKLEFQEEKCDNGSLQLKKTPKQYMHV